LIYVIFQERLQIGGYQTNRKKVPVGTINSTTRQECVGELEN